MSCARVQTYTAAKISAAEKHNEKKTATTATSMLYPKGFR